MLELLVKILPTSVTEQDINPDINRVLQSILSNIAINFVDNRFAIRSGQNNRSSSDHFGLTFDESIINIEGVSTIELKIPPGRSRIIRTKSLLQKVKNRLIYKGRPNARKLANPLGVSKGTIGRIIHGDLHLHAYHITIQPNLKDEQKEERVSFPYWVRKSLKKQD
ncbi:unnamed protein product [Rotaria socialis]|uniref:Uncharacterized protein n=1 Tax=Rotaria socialis TaxID=392032 RepID=A0A819ZMQ9_9BILA|nr:unnamed protein product [Rotaria socialis]CAF4334369.1 unnamed protein product [Rotaria socialis]CAF4514183.1 unnamed protein product [Rotaria socialis]CAF4689249.1 unnamed protein product [Rotaria socialis]